MAHIPERYTFPPLSHVLTSSPTTPHSELRTPHFPLSCYVHVPFCVHRCGYCNFTLVARREDLIPRYLDAVERELATHGEPSAVETLFFGGGTPTHLPPAALERLCQSALRQFPLLPGYEWSVEANPADLDTERIAVLREQGVTRVSLGVQSFSAEKLSLLERDHRADDIRRAVDLLRPWVKSLAIDLIFGAPGETLADWESDLRQALTLEPDHVSTYGLTFERGTTFWGRKLRGELRVAEESDERAMYETAIDTLTAAGFEHYEVSNFARPGHRCRHNECYWDGREYFAIGPGAARYVAGRREINHRSTTTYIERVLGGRSPVADGETLSPVDRAREAFVFGMRRLRGVHLPEFAERYGVDPRRLFAAQLAKYVQLGMFVQQGDWVRLTRPGLLVSDAIWPDFLA
ncbi:MAG: radical SAM family heme chaperone HemW [Planctomycetaceae bacterium]|nr:radical SAM family heme chaperone HemW [Planctomycetaceae bacterium]